MRRLVMGFLSSALVVAGLQTQARADDPPVSDEAVAFAEAQKTGEKVEIVEDRTETETVWATPEGTFAREISNAPIRVREGDGWEPVDLDLAVRDGVVRPKAAPGEVSLSAGGRDALMRLSVGDVTTSVTWPGALPAPQLDGPTATYVDVIDDVDLRMTVTDGGVSQILVVKTPEAAADPRLATLRLPTEVENGRVESASGGGFSVIDEAGRTVGEAPAPVMWDSSGKVVGEHGRAVHDGSAEAVDRRTQGPAENDEVSPVDLEVAGGDLVLKPETEALTGADVEYPVYIDPKAGARAFAWAMVFKQYPSSSFYKWTDDEGQGVGYQNYSGVSNKRLYFQHSLSSVTGHQILSATFKAAMVWSPNCTTRPIRVYRSGAVTSGTTWNNQPSLGDYQDKKSYSAGHSGCNPGGRDVVWNIKSGVTAAAAEGRPTIGLAMRAEDESDPLNWRRFKHTASITVEYNRRPSVPTARTINGISCPESTVVRLGKMTSYPVMRTKLSDPDGNNVRPLWEWNSGASISSARKQIVGSYVGSGSTAARPLDVMGKNADESVKSGTWTFQILAQDSVGLKSAASDECTFTIDSTLAATPIVTGLPNESDPTVQWESKPYDLTFAPGDGAGGDTVGYRFAIDSDQPPTTAMLAASGVGKTRTVALPAQSVGLHTLSVWGYDAANNRSEAPFVVEFEVVDPDAYTRSTYDFDEVEGPTAFDPLGGHPMPIGDASRATRALYIGDDAETPDRDGMIVLSSSTLELPTVTAPLVDPTRSFSMAAFLDPAQTAATGTNLTAISLGSENAPGLQVGAEANGSGFDYVARLWDVTTSAWVTARVPGDDGLPGTTPLVVTYDAVAKKATLRVLGDNPASGVTPGNVTLPSTFARQRMVLGAAHDGTQRWTGSIDQVIAARGVLSEDEITNFETTWSRTECVASNGAC